MPSKISTEIPKQSETRERLIAIVYQGERETCKATNLELIKWISGWEHAIRGDLLHAHQNNNKLEKQIKRMKKQIKRMNAELLILPEINAIKKHLEKEAKNAN